MAENKYGWVVPVVLGVTAIGVGGYILYTAFASPITAATKAASDALQYWMADYASELNAIAKQNTLPTAAQEDALAKKQQEINTAYANLNAIYTTAEQVLIAAGAAVAGAFLISALAKNYWKTHAGQIKTPNSATQLYREAESIDLYAQGNTSLAVALNTQTQYVFSTVYGPAMQTEIATLNASITTLTGTALLWAQFLVNSLQLEISNIIPSFFNDAATLLSTPLAFSLRNPCNCLLYA